MSPVNMNPPDPINLPVVDGDPIDLCIARCLVTGLYRTVDTRALKLSGRRVAMCIVGATRRWEIFAYEFNTELAAAVFAALVRQVGERLTVYERSIVSIDCMRQIVTRILHEMESGEQSPQI